MFLFLFLLFYTLLITFIFYMYDIYIIKPLLVIYVIEHDILLYKQLMFIFVRSFIVPLCLYSAKFIVCHIDLFPSRLTLLSTHIKKIKHTQKKKKKKKKYPCTYSYPTLYQPYLPNPNHIHAISQRTPFIHVSPYRSTL